MKAIITVVGKDMVGIMAKVSNVAAEANANILEVTQSVLEGYFAMIMLVDLSAVSWSIDELQTALRKNAEGMQIHVMHEDIFTSMHHV
ncbi:MAG: ACT domain-containing protein [Clostridiales bacterium]|nr:ACT domain-containing protein [Clostridiales bacterium]